MFHETILSITLLRNIQDNIHPAGILHPFPSNSPSPPSVQFKDAGCHSDDNVSGGQQMRTLCRFVNLQYYFERHFVPGPGTASDAPSPCGRWEAGDFRHQTPSVKVSAFAFWSISRKPFITKLLQASSIYNGSRRGSVVHQRHRVSSEKFRNTPRSLTLDLD